MWGEILGKNGRNWGGVTWEVGCHFYRMGIGAQKGEVFFFLKSFGGGETRVARKEFFRRERRGYQQKEGGCVLYNKRDAKRGAR